ncbi:MAG: 3'-5' exonuclease [Clostridia bacterium]|nr:3'-5' exonuclease [Clostridia bacterium]
MENRKLLIDTQFLVIDFETITPKGRSPEPIEVGIIRIKENEIDRTAAVSWLIKPPKGLHLTKFDTEQTGIKEQDLIGKQSAEQVMRKINNSCKKTEYVFMAQNARYEANILSHYTDQFPAIAQAPIIDTILLAKHILPNLPNYKLNTLAKAVGVDIPPDRHRALADCVLTSKVYLKLMELQKQKKEIKYLDELLQIAEIQTSYNKPKQLELFDFIDR